jgi:hypothetical protein
LKISLMKSIVSSVGSTKVEPYRCQRSTKVEPYRCQRTHTL